MGLVSIRPNFSSPDLDKMFKTRLAQIEKNITDSYIETGEYFLEFAQENAEFMNHTFNLRSSIGYGVVKDGFVIKSRFEQVGPGEEGVRKGSIVLQQAAGEVEIQKGFVLIGVAGMEYAIFVESYGKDVISNSAGAAETLLKKFVK